MRKNTLRNVLVLLCSIIINASLFGQINCSVLPQKSNPAMAVNDFANIIDATTEQRLESTLRTYWDSTTIALSVITVTNMNGNEQMDYSTSLFNCWGIGGENNRGILLFVALEERKISIRTGYGIEFALTDLQCNDIIDEMKPLFKKERYSEGIELGVNNILKVLGTMSWEDRMQGIAEQKIAHEKRRKKQIDALIDVLIFAVIGGIIVALIIFLRRRFKRLKKIRAITKLIASMEQEIQKALTMIDTAMDQYSSDARWVKKQAQEHKSHANHDFAEANGLIVQAKSILHTEPDDARELLDKVDVLIEKSFANFSKLMNGLKEKSEKISKDAPVRLADARQMVANNIKKTQIHINAGYKFKKEQEQQENLNQQLIDYETKINDREYHADIYTGADVIKQKSTALLADITTTVHQREIINNQLDHLITRGKNVPVLKMILKISKNYKEHYPQTVWQHHEVALEKMKNKLSTSRLVSLRDEITDLNSMEKQKFISATQKFNELSSLIDEATQLCATVDAIEEQQNTSKKVYPTTYKATSDLVEKAMHKIKDSDVGSDAKSKAKEAQRKLKEVEIEAGQSLVDWVFILSLLSTVSDKAQHAIRQADDDIRQAENEREEERRRKRKREEESNSYSYSSSYSNNNDFGGGGGFGGFDGGSSGGGGADGGW